MSSRLVALAENQSLGDASHQQTFTFVVRDIDYFFTFGFTNDILLPQKTVGKRLPSSSAMESTSKERRGFHICLINIEQLSWKQ